VSPRNRAALSELVNALQVAAPLATAVRKDSASASENAVKLEAAVHRAAVAVRQLQPTKKEKS